MVLIIVIFSFMNIAASTMVNSGVVKIKVMASGTGMNFTHANDVSMVRLPKSPIIQSMTLWYAVLGQKLSPVIIKEYFKCCSKSPLIYVPLRN